MEQNESISNLGFKLLFDTCVFRQCSEPTHGADSNILLHSCVASTYGGKWWISVVIDQIGD
jgi:hypothetical protein